MDVFLGKMEGLIHTAVNISLGNIYSNTFDISWSIEVKWFAWNYIGGSRTQVFWLSPSEMVAQLIYPSVILKHILYARNYAAWGEQMIIFCQCGKENKTFIKL